MTETTQHFENGKLSHLSELLVDNCDKLFEHFKLELSKSGNMYIGCCPIHGGDNKSAFNFYSDGHTIKGNWKCRTHNCQQTFKPTILGFIRGMLSSQNGWEEGSTEKVYPWNNTISWACKFLNLDWKNVTVSQSYTEAKKFIASTEALAKKRITTQGTPRESVIKNLAIPAKFFIERGFSEAMLRKYDIGYCLQSKHGFDGRVITPVYDDSGKNMVAYSGRTINPICNKCDSYHKVGISCPDEKIKHLYSKWKHSPGINNYLFNYWFAKKNIKRKGKVILVEGPLDVLRLEEFGIDNAVALFGCDITEQQQIILETSGCLSIILLLDMDAPGRAGCEIVANKLRNSYNIQVPLYGTHDPGELSKEEALRICQ